MAPGLLVCRLLECYPIIVNLISKGPDVHGISSDVPDGCTVDQAAYVVRHGSRYPDPGAYSGWVALYQKVILFHRGLMITGH
jgi:hypothetical protein